MKYSIIVILLCLIGCQREYNNFRLYYPTGELKEQKQFVASDTNSYDFTSFYKDGKVNEKYSIRDGLIEGKTFKFSESGVLLNSYNYSKGKLHGICQDYTNYGGLLRRYLYLNDKLKVLMELYINKREKNQINYAVYNVDENKSKLNGELYIKNNEIISDSSFYYLVSINDTFNSDEKIMVKIKSFSKGANCSMDIFIDGLDTNLIFKNSNIFHRKCNSNIDSFYLNNRRYGYNLLLGKLIISNNDNRIGEFILFDEFYVKK